MSLRDCFVLAALVSASGPGLYAQTVEPPFDADYNLVDLGPVTDLPFPSGGLTFADGDPDTLIIGGRATSFEGKLYTVPLARDAAGHVTGFSGPATWLASAPHVDGGVAWGPDGILFVSRFPTNEISQFLPGSTAPDKVNDLFAVGVSPSPGGLNFVPVGFPGAGDLKIVSWDAGEWYTLTLAADGAGLFDVVSATLAGTLPGGPEGFAYIPAGSPQFPSPDSLLVSEWSDGNVAVYQVDANGNPVAATRRVFIDGLQNAEGAVIDPVTGDFLFSTFGGSAEHVYAIRGFAAPDDGDEPGDGEPPVCSIDHPRSPGYWHRQCLALDRDRGGKTVGRGPASPVENGFAERIVPCAGAMLDAAGFMETTCKALEAWPAFDTCEHALRNWTTQALNVCSGRVSATCPVKDSSHCSAVDVNELLGSTADAIRSGSCHAASVCLESTHPTPGDEPQPLDDRR